MKWNLAGFCPYRVAWVTAILSFALPPMHSYVSCEMSGRIALCGIVLFAVTAVLALVGGLGKVATPLTLATLGLVINMLFAH
jgi:hypothetical protein